MMDAILVDVQRAGTHDGPGIRTVFFFKGCPLRCRWCHNPESWRREPQLSFRRDACIYCGRCMTVCPIQAHRVEAGPQPVHRVRFDLCTHCGRCATVCPSHALKRIGASYTPEALLEIARRDLPFYRQSGGGVTLSGGEVLLWADFAERFLSLCRDEGIHTCVETSGCGTAEAMEKLIPVTDLFYFDWKVSGEAEAWEYLGGRLGPIRENLRLLDRWGQNIVLRCPIIPGINDNEGHFGSILGLAEEFPSIRKVQLLPYHDFGISKSRNIGEDMASFPVPGPEDTGRWLEWFSGRRKAKAPEIELG